MLKDILQKHDKDIFTDAVVEGVESFVEKEIKKRVDERLIDINEAHEAELVKINERVDTMSEAYETERNELEMAKIDAMEKWLEDTKQEVFEANKMDYENVAVVKEAIEVHRMNVNMQKKYNIDSVPQQIEEKEINKKLKDDFNALYKTAEVEYKARVKAQNDLVIYKLAEGLETETDRDKLLQLSKTIQFDTPEDFEVTLKESMELIFDKSVNEDEDTTKVGDTIINENKSKKNKYGWLNG